MSTLGSECGVDNVLNNKGKAVLKATTDMGRAILIAEFYINVSFKNDKQLIAKGGPAITEKLYPLYIATSHYESLDNLASRDNRQS